MTFEAKDFKMCPRGLHLGILQHYVILFLTVFRLNDVLVGHPQFCECEVKSFFVYDFMYFEIVQAVLSFSKYSNKLDLFIYSAAM